MSPFASPPDPIIFNNQVWEFARQIPAGKVATYGQIARMIPPPEGVEVKSYLSLGPRWAGSAMAKCPEDVPWQRVINSQGKISLRPGAEEQRQLLESEGIEFDDRERVDFTKVQWSGPDEAWCKAHGLVQPSVQSCQQALF